MRTQQQDISANFQTRLQDRMDAITTNAFNDWKGFREIGAKDACPLTRVLPALAKVNAKYKTQNFLSFLIEQFTDAAQNVEAADYNKKCLDNVAEILIEIGSSVVPDLLSLLTSESEQVKRYTVIVLGKIGSVAAVPGLRNLISNSTAQSDDLLECTAEALGKIGSEDAIMPLLALLEFNNNSVKAIAAQALGNIGAILTALGKSIPENVVNALSNALTNRDAQVKQQVTRALGMIGSENAVFQLLALLKDKSLGIIAADMLGMGGSLNIVLLLLAIETTNATEIENIRRALSRIRSVEAIPTLIKALESQHAMNVLNNNPIVFGIMQALRNIDSADTIHQLLAIETTEPRFLKNIGQILSGIRTLKAIPALESVKAHKDASIKYGAQLALENMDVPSLSESVSSESMSKSVKDLQSENISERRNAQVHLVSLLRQHPIEVLSKIAASSEAIIALVKALDDMDTNGQMSAGDLLGRLQKDSCLRIFGQEAMPMNISTTYNLARGVRPFPLINITPLQETLARQLSRLNVQEWEMLLSNMSTEEYERLEQVFQQSCAIFTVSRLNSSG